MKKQVRTSILWALWLTIVVAVTFLVSQYCVQLMLIQGNSMLPSYHNMQIVLVNKQVDHYQKGDVVAFFCDGLEEKRVTLVKRLVAVPGDIVQIKEGTLIVNEHISEHFSKKGMFDDSCIAEEPIQLGEDEYFVIGDNISESKDSRLETIGTISKSQLIGKIIN